MGRTTYINKDDILERASYLVGKSLRELIPLELIPEIESRITKYKRGRKGFFGNLVEKFGFHLRNNNYIGPDFQEAKIELKSTPVILDKKKHIYKAKERLVFSMINYNKVVHEDWSNSSFINKNQNLLLIFYLYNQSQNLLDYKITHQAFINLLNDLSNSDILQISEDWKFIVNKIKNGNAHLLSEGDTVYLGAATKARSSQDRRSQPYSDVKAKPRAFSLKQSYLNTLIAKITGDKPINVNPLIPDSKEPTIVGNMFEDMLSNFYGLSEEDIAAKVGIVIAKDKPKPKQIRRMLVDKILGVKDKKSKIEELVKSDATLKVINLENNGNLKESIPFPAFKYMDIVEESWEESTLYNQLTSKRFLFVVFRKYDKTSRLEKILFWNFPMEDIDEAHKVWRNTREKVKECCVDQLPKLKDSFAIHVRPHAQNKKDQYEIPCGGKAVKKSFWLNAKYIQKFISSDK